MKSFHVNKTKGRDRLCGENIETTDYKQKINLP
jgi:hypothetical protein